MRCGRQNDNLYEDTISLILICFVYKIFAVLHLRIRLFPLLTAWKENGTGVYAGISFHEFYTFFLFNLLICSFLFYSLIFSIPFLYP